MAEKVLTTVVNIHNSPYDVFIGRPSIFGNPFHISIPGWPGDGTREEVVYKHLIYFYKRLISDPQFKCAVLALRGKRLGCYCHEWQGEGKNPMYCHGDNIADCLNGLQK